MILNIIVSTAIFLVLLVLIFKGTKKALKKLKEKIKKDNNKLDQEFKDGKILLPIDKRDFSDFKEFKEKTKGIKKINVKLQDDKLKEDFEKWCPPGVEVEAK